jgi:hypothetical protein
MIYGVKQIDSENKIEYDYVACLFPEGNIDDEHRYVFNHDKIDKIFHLGLQDEEQYNFNKNILSKYKR